jgi:hypothetical protein
MERPPLLTFPLYPSALAAWFVVSVWLPSSLDLPPLLRPLVIGLAFGLALTIVAVAVTRNWQRGGAIAGVAVLGVIGGDDGRVLGLAALMIGGLLLLAVRERQFERRLPWDSLTRLLNLVAIAMLGILVARAAFMTLGLPPRAATAATVPAAGAERPDIIVILLDAHGREDILADLYGEDISGFVAALRDRGFDVSPRSRSNYMNTQLTLSSMFNLVHLSELNLPPETDQSYGAGLRTSLDRNRAFELLRAGGYHIGTVSPGYEGVALRSADVFLEGGQVSELETVLISNSALRRALDIVAGDALGDQARARVRWNLEPSNWLPGIAAAATDAEPYFMFVHVPSPHFPYLFDRDGVPLPDRRVVVPNPGDRSEMDPQAQSATGAAYAGQLAFVDGLAIAAVDKVIAAVPSNAVVIVMSDHGPDVHIDWDHLETADTRERFGTLFAARTLGHERLFGDAPTPVNLFATLLNAYVGMDLPLQSNSSFIGYPPRKGLLEIGDPDLAVH